MYQNYNTGYYNNNQSTIFPQYYNMNPNIDQYTAMVNQYSTMVNPQYTTVPPQYPMNSMNTQFPNAMMMNSVVLNNQRNLYNQYNMNNSQYMQNNAQSFSATNVRLPTKPGNNTSLIRILQCLYSILKIKISSTIFIIKDMIKNKNISVPISLKLFEILNIAGKNYPNQNNDPNFLNSIQELRNQVSLKEARFKGINEIEPKMVFYDLFSLSNQEFVNKSNGTDNDIFYLNQIFKNLKELPILPKSSFKKVYDNIDKFSTDFSTPFVDEFYFILLELYKCNNCQNIIKAITNVSFFISLKGEIDGANVTNLLANYIMSPSNNNSNVICNRCNNNNMIQKYYSFMNTPKYLLIDFEGRKLSKCLENEIDLSTYSMTNIGPKKYSLYAYITRDSNNQKYIEYIKNKDDWYKYSEENNAEKLSNPQNINFCLSPYMVIYKGNN